MGKAYFRLLFLIFVLALCICGSLRIVFKLFNIDHSTGFYYNEHIGVTLFNIVLGAALVVFLLLNRLKRGRNDYPVYYRNRMISLLCVATGISIGFFNWYGLTPELAAHIAENSMFRLVVFYVVLFTGILSALLMVWSGLSEALRFPPPPGMLMLCMPIWQVMVLLSRFNDYQAVVPKSDSLLMVLFMVFSALFYMGHSRNICGMGRKDGRNYVIPMGLGTALCGLLIAVPNLVYVIAYRSAIPVRGLAVPEMVYVILLSVYALVYVVGFNRSIQYV